MNINKQHVHVSIKDTEREEITRDLADKLAKLAEAVGEVLSNSG